VLPWTEKGADVVRAQNVQRAARRRFPRQRCRRGHTNRSGDVHGPSTAPDLPRHVAISRPLIIAPCDIGNIEGRPAQFRLMIQYISSKRSTASNDYVWQQRKNAKYRITLRYTGFR